MPAKIAVVIPARYGSTRFPGKPLHLVAGKPLLQRVWERCRRAKGIDAIIIATDDQRIADAGRAFGAEVVMTSARHRSGTDRCAEVAGQFTGFTHFINVQGDEPMIDPSLISRLAKELAGDAKIGMITAATTFGPDEDVKNPNAVKVVLDRESNAIYFSRSPIPFVRDLDASATYLKHQGIYGFTAAFLLQFVKWKPGRLEGLEQLEQLRVLENGATMRVVIAKTASIGIDVPADVPVVERLLTSR
jgi:3-deoxy-manno-octulosonate cytidylyltransferase (CMP-KDO synthetase)